MSIGLVTTVELQAAVVDEHCFLYRHQNPFVDDHGKTIWF